VIAPEMLKVGPTCVVAVKFSPVTLAPLTVVVCVLGLKV